MIEEDITSPRELMEKLTPNAIENYGWYNDHCPNFKNHSKATSDADPSFGWREHLDGHIQVKCFAGCTTKQICDALKISPTQLYPLKYDKPMVDLFNPDQRYLYKVTSNRILYEIWRWKYDILGEKLKKKVTHFVHDHPSNPKIQIHRNDTGIELILYNYDKIYISPKEETIYFVEGEKDAKTCGKLGLLATTTAFGAGNSHLTKDLSVCDGRNIVFFHDNDKPGKKYAVSLAIRLSKITKSIKIVDLNTPDTKLPRGGDITDWCLRYTVDHKRDPANPDEVKIDYKGTVEKLQKIIDATPECGLQLLNDLASKLEVNREKITLTSAPTDNMKLFLKHQFLFLESDEEFYLIRYGQGQFWYYDFKSPAEWKILDEDLRGIYIQSFYDLGVISIPAKNIKIDAFNLPGVEGTAEVDFKAKNNDIREMEGALKRCKKIYVDFKDVENAIRWLVEENPNENRPEETKITPLRNNLLDITDFNDLKTFDKTPFLWHTYSLNVDEKPKNPMIFEKGIIPFDDIVKEILDNREEMVIQYGKMLAVLLFFTEFLRDTIMISIGIGGSGKTTLFDIIRIIYPMKAILETGVYQLSDDPFAWSRLPEVSIVSLDNCKWMSGTNYHRFVGELEKLTSKIPLMVRQSMKSGFEFLSYAKVMATAAVPPPYAETGRQFRRRLFGIHCPNHYPVDRTFSDRNILPQKEFIFYEWAPHYLKKFYDEGFLKLELMEQMFDDAKPAAESLGDFIRATYRRTKGSKIFTKEVWYKWKAHVDLLDKMKTKDLTTLKSYINQGECSKEVTIECGYLKKSSTINKETGMAFLDMELIPPPVEKTDDK